MINTWTTRLRVSIPDYAFQRSKQNWQELRYGKGCLFLISSDSLRGVCDGRSGGVRSNSAIQRRAWQNVHFSCCGFTKSKYVDSRIPFYLTLRPRALWELLSIRSRVGQWALHGVSVCACVCRCMLVWAAVCQGFFFPLKGLFFGGWLSQSLSLSQSVTRSLTLWCDFFVSASVFRLWKFADLSVLQGLSKKRQREGWIWWGEEIRSTGRWVCRKHHCRFVLCLVFDLVTVPIWHVINACNPPMKVSSNWKCIENPMESWELAKASGLGSILIKLWS